MKFFFILLVLVFFSGLGHAQTSGTESWQLQTSSDGSAPAGRHESGLAQVGGKLYLLGGRGSRNVDRYDPVSKTWEALDPMPIELHHFQPVVIGSRIYVIGAFTCCYPNEEIVADIYVYNTVTQVWHTEGTMPTDRLRGSAAAVLHQGKIYLLGGNTAGHSGGAVAWFDEFDPTTGEWLELEDAPNARDHFMLAVAYGKLVASAGRQTAFPATFANPVLATDVYDLSANSWVSTTDIPTARAGALAIARGAEVIVAGGEINTSTAALSTVEVFNIESEQWRSLQSMNIGRHSGGGALLGEQMHVVAGSQNRGGAPETNSHEILQLDAVSDDVDNDGLDTVEETQVHLTDPLDPDTDDDGLFDGVEIELGSSPLVADSDGDTLEDGIEVNQHMTDPLSADSDNDQLSDADEIELFQTDPLLADSDLDGLLDGDEVNVHSSDPLLQDTDQDGLQDGAEVLVYGSSPISIDTDEDGLNDGDEIAAGTDIAFADSDLDGLLDGEDEEPLSALSSGGSGGSFTVWGLLALLVGCLSRHQLFMRQYSVKEERKFGM